MSVKTSAMQLAVPSHMQNVLLQECCCTKQPHKSGALADHCDQQNKCWQSAFHSRVAGCFDYSAGGRLQTGEDKRLNEFFPKDDEPLLTGPTK